MFRYSMVTTEKKKKKMWLFKCKILYYIALQTNRVVFITKTKITNKIEICHPRHIFQGLVMEEYSGVKPFIRTQRFNTQKHDKTCKLKAVSHYHNVQLVQMAQLKIFHA